MKKLICRGLFIAFLGVITPFIGNGQITSGHEDFDQYVESAVENFEIAGLSIAIVKDGKVVFENAYGLANEVDEEAMEIQDNFAIASLSKAFTAFSIGMLVEEGKLSWDDRVSEHLPSFSLSDEYVASQMTIEDLLCHRSGFKTFDGDLLWYNTNYDRREIIERFEAYPTTYDFRTKYGYQNIMFIIAGEIVAEVSGMSWEDFIEQRIFKPLEMEHSHATYRGFESEENVALPHVKGKMEGIRNYDNSGGAAAISSNVKDLSHWISMWLNNGIYGDDTLISEATHQKLLDMHTPIPPSKFDRNNGIQFKGYALGWFLMDYTGFKVAYHGGGLPGYISKIFLLPNEGLGGIILSNGESSLPTALMYSCIDEFQQTTSDMDWAATYLGYSKRYEDHLASREEQRKEQRGKGKANISEQELIGKYHDRYYGEAVVEKRDGKLHLSLLPAEERFSSDMMHWQQNTYQIRFKDEFLPAGYVSFQSNANGEVVGFQIDLPNPDFHFHNLDFKKVGE